MTGLMQTPQTMTSREIADLLETRHDNVKRTMERLSTSGVIRFTPSEETSHEGSGARPVEVYRVEKRDSYIVVAQLSPEFTARLVDRWQELENGAAPQRALSPAEQLLAMAQLSVDIERKQAAQAEQIVGIAAQVEELKQSGSPLASCPSTAESLTSIRRRMHKQYGLSEAIIDTVVRDCPYAPRPLATVRNGHESAQDSTYVVFAKKDVTAIFKRFVSECQPVSATRSTHPFVNGRFRTPKREARNAS